MGTIKIISVAIFGALLAACGGGSSSNTRADAPPPTSGPAQNSSLSSVPQEFREAVSAAKTITTEIEEGELTIGGKKEQYNYSDLPNGLTEMAINLSYKTEKGANATASGTELVYQQPYSVIVGDVWDKDSGDEFEPDELGILLADDALGLRTSPLAINTLVGQKAVFNYQGIALDGHEQGTLKYTMDFGALKGSGSITGFSRTGAIELLASNIFINGLKGTIQKDGYVAGPARIEKAPAGANTAMYELEFFGPNADEIAGEVHDIRDGNALGGAEIIFAGKR